MTQETLELINAIKGGNSINDTIISVMAGIIVVCFTIIGFFLSKIVSDVKSNTSNIGKNKGKIELVEQQQKSDTERIEKMTQLELKVLGERVGDLSDNINILVKAMIEDIKGS